MAERTHEPELTEEQDDSVITKALVGSLVGFLALAGIGTGAYFYLKPEPKKVVATDIKPTLPTVRSQRKIELPKTPMTDITQSSGLKFKHVCGAYGDKLLPETMGGGGGFIDYDSDGDYDVILVNSCYWPDRPEAKKPDQPKLALFQNDGKGNYLEVTKEAGLETTLYGMGPIVGDYDGDGKEDLVITALGQFRLFKNLGGKFQDVTESAKLKRDGFQWTTSGAFVDVDRDGDLDLFLCSYVQWNKEFDLAQSCQLLGLKRAYCQPRNFPGSFCILYRNNGDGTFADVSEAAGMHVRSKTQINGPIAKSLGVAPVDLNRDGWIDLVVANDTVQNFVFLNNKNGTFTESGERSGIGLDGFGGARGAMGIDTSYFRNDDRLGVVIGNFAEEMTALYVSQPNGKSFVDVSNPVGLGPKTRLNTTFGIFFVDYDLDGRPDIFAANGHLEEEIQKARKEQTYEQPARLYWNAGRGEGDEFILATASELGDEFSKPVVGRGASYADIDGDGDADFLITCVDKAPRLIRNDQKLGNGWATISLEDSTSKNRFGLGALVEIQAAGKTRRMTVTTSRSYLASSTPTVTFGLGDCKSIDEIHVIWPTGEPTKMKPTVINQVIKVKR